MSDYPKHANDTVLTIAMIETAQALQNLEAIVSVLGSQTGALADDDLYRSLDDAAVAGSSRLRLASGAIGALDALRAARTGSLTEVRYTGRKPPAGWKGSPAESKLDLDHLTGDPAVHFEGTARVAATEYPKNANVAAAYEGP